MKVAAAFLVVSAAGHAAITYPAQRQNPTVDAGLWCAWCQGSIDQCDPSTTSCSPPSPCWGAVPGTIEAHYFNQYNVKDADGQPWIDPAGGAAQAPPLWCPGTTVPIKYFLFADHNGVYRWETQLAEPGMETEDAFRSITSWRSVNNDPETQYFDKSGTVPVPEAWCPTPDSGPQSWSPEVSHCRNELFARTSLTLPADLPAGKTVVRWLWFGAMTVDGERVVGPETSLFTNCMDVVVGTPEQCGTPRPGCPGGSLSACIGLCPSDDPAVFRLCVDTCEARCTHSLYV